MKSSESTVELPTLPDTVRANIELLENATNGEHMVEAYKKALEYDPSLTTVLVRPLSRPGEQHAAAVPKWASHSGKHEVEIRLYGDNAIKRAEAMTSEIPGAKELYAEMAGVRSEELTPELLNIFIFLHELGHTSEYIQFEDRQEEYRVRNIREWIALPLGTIATSVLMNQSTDAHQDLKKRINTGASQYRSMEEAFGAQHSAYRGMAAESYADTFASAVISQCPELVETLKRQNP